MSKIYKLRFPDPKVKGKNGQMIEEITVRRPKAGEVIDVIGDRELTSQQKDLNLLAKLTGINPEDLRELDWEDYQELDQILGDLMSPPEPRDSEESKDSKPD